MMTDSELQAYIPKAGDRIALRSFLSSNLSKRGIETRKQGLMEKLREKLRSRKSDPQGVVQDPDQYGKKCKSNNEKDKVKIELGWMHYNEKNGQFSQVRLRCGGGTRHIQVDKTASKGQIQEIAQCLFFPDGNSSKGSIETFHCNLTDFKADEVDETHTLADFIKKTKIYKLRFYLTTKKKNSSEEKEDQLQPNSQSAEDECRASTSEQLDQKEISAPLEIYKKVGATTNTQNSEGRKLEKDAEMINNGMNSCNNIRQEEFLERICDVPTASLSFSDNAVSDTNEDLPNLLIPSRVKTENPQVAEIGQSDVIESTSILTPLGENTWIDSLGEVYIAGFKPLDDTPKQFHVEVHRGHAFNDIRQFFKVNVDINPKVDEVRLTLILPNGDTERAADSGGVTRDVITEFWQEFYQCCTLGYELKVPTLRHDFEKDDWAAVARVLAFGWTSEKMLPDQLAPSFLNACLNGVNSENDDTNTILEEYCQFLSDTEKDLITKTLDDFDGVEFDELLEFLSNHDCKVRVSKENVKTVLLQIADKKLNQEPAFVREVFFSTLLPFNLEIDIRKELQKLKVTKKRVLSIIEYDPTQQTSKFLLKFLRECNMEVMRRFLRFTTASDMMLTDANGEYMKIKIQLLDMKGLARRPIAHTCGRVLELALTYENFPEFRCEMNAVLASNIWVMDIC